MAANGYRSGPQRVVKLPKVSDAPAGGSSRSRGPSVTDAAANGSHRELLVALRARLAKTIQDENTPPRDLASLSLRLLGIAKEIEGLDAAEGLDDVGAAAGTPDEEWAAP